MKMTPVCPFAKALRPDDSSTKKSGENLNKHQLENEDKAKRESGDSASISKCPFAKMFRRNDGLMKKSDENLNKHLPENEDKDKRESKDSASISPKCPFAKDLRPNDSSMEKSDENLNRAHPEDENKAKMESDDPATIPPKCPFGYDSQTFKIGPLSCIICQALLFNCSKCVPCSHVFCKSCISRFKDCPLCGADIESIEDDANLQGAVDRFIEGHARIKRSHVENDPQGVANDSRNVIYEDVSLERGAFLVQQAMRAFRGQNIDSAKSRLSLCAEDIREQIDRTGSTSELCSQLGAVLGMLGDCCRATGDSASAIMYFEESVEFLSKLPTEDQEITHTLSVSLNKVGDLKYYNGDLQAARSYYFRSLNVRRDSVKHHPNAPSQVLDVATSLAKVADVDRNLGNEDVAIDGFQEAIKILESLTLTSGEAALKHRRSSVLEFLKNQVMDKQPDAAI